MADEKTTHDHLTELHKLNEKALASFRRLEAAIAAQPVHRSVTNAAAETRQAVEEAASASHFKLNTLASKPEPKPPAAEAPPPKPPEAKPPALDPAAPAPKS